MSYLLFIFFILTSNYIKKQRKKEGVKTLKELLVKCPVPDSLVEKFLKVSGLLYELHGVVFSIESIYSPFVHDILLECDNDVISDRVDSFIADLERKVKEDEIKG